MMISSTHLVERRDRASGNTDLFASSMMPVSISTSIIDRLPGDEQR